MSDKLKKEKFITFINLIAAIVSFAAMVITIIYAFNSYSLYQQVKKVYEDPSPKFSNDNIIRKTSGLATKALGYRDFFGLVKEVRLSNGAVLPLGTVLEASLIYPPTPWLTVYQNELRPVKYKVLSYSLPDGKGYITLNDCIASGTAKADMKSNRIISELDNLTCKKASVETNIPLSAFDFEEKNIGINAIPIDRG